MSGTFLRSVGRRLSGALRDLRWYRYVQDAAIRSACCEMRLPLGFVTQSTSHVTIRLPNSELRVPLGNAAYTIVAGYAPLADLDESGACMVEWSDELGTLIVRSGHACYAADSREELAILAEILVGGHYDVRFSGPAVLLDIGANVGYASLYLASLNSGLMIEGFEPLGANLEKARRNLHLNPQLSARIHLNDFGLYSENGTGMLSTESGRRGMSSLVIDRKAGGRDGVESVEVAVRRASDVIRAVKDQHVDRRLVVKMDCEGSEYAIVDDLVKTGAISLVDFVVMEWHRLDGNPGRLDALREQLVGSGFHVAIRDRLRSPGLAGLAIATRAWKDGTRQVVHGS